MKPKTILLTFAFICGSLLAKATTHPACGPGNDKKNDIAGSVTNAETRKPLKDVSITAYLDSKKEKIIVTDKCGTYAFDDLKPGTYKFVFEKEGYRKVVKEKVMVKVDEGFQLDIEMVQDTEADLMPSPSHFLYN